MRWIHDVNWFFKRRLYRLVDWGLEKLEPPLTVEQIERKNRSIAKLVEEGVAFIDWLPVIETEKQSIRRSDEDVLKRLITTIIVAQYAEKQDKAVLNSLIEKYSTYISFSPEEAEFLRDEPPETQKAINMSWRFEAAMVLLWALGFVEDLQRPDKTYNSENMSEWVKTGAYNDLLARTNIRPQSAILNEADLIYRYHWAAKNARLVEEIEPTGLDEGVLRERHHALNWLIGYDGQEWDDVTTDT